MSDDAVRNATGHGWDHWFRLLDDAGGVDLDHKALVREVQGAGVSGWWAQTVTVEYERRIGRRAVGETQQGDYQVAVSRTLPGSLDEVLDAWTAFMDGTDDLDDVAIVDGPVTSRTPDWRYWRAGLADGTRVNVVVGAKGERKVSLTAGHEKLPDAEAKEAWRAFWKQELDRFKADQA